MKKIPTSGNSALVYQPLIWVAILFANTAKSELNRLECKWTRKWKGKDVDETSWRHPHCRGAFCASYHLDIVFFIRPWTVFKSIKRIDKWNLF